MQGINITTPPEGIIEDENFYYIKDFSLVGFKISNPYCNFYFLCNTNTDNILVRTSFLMNEREMDLQYLNFPMHDIINIEKYKDIKAKSVAITFSKFDDSNSYYSTFDPDEFVDHNAICYGLRKSEKHEDIKTKFVVNMDTFIRISLLKSQVNLRIPMNIAIDSDAALNGIGSRIYELSGLKFIGSDTASNIVRGMNTPDSSVEAHGVFAFFSAHIGLKSKLIILPLQKLKDQIVISAIDGKKMIDLYKNNTMFIDMRFFGIMHWILKDNTKKDVVYLLDINGNELDMYIDTENEIEDSPIMDPYRYVYKEKDKNANSTINLR